MARRERVHVTVDDHIIATGDSARIIEPVWWSVTIYDGAGMYHRSFERFSVAQKHVFAISWYISEVSNGGHDQFYSNATGMVWEDAHDGFVAIGLPQGAAIIRISADRLGGYPSLDRQERQDQIEQQEPDFEDCDDALYSLLEKQDVESLVMAYIRARPSHFYFSGEIERVVLPTFDSY